MLGPLSQPGASSRANDGCGEQPATAQFRAEGLSQTSTLQECSEPSEPTEQRQADGERRQTGKNDREHQGCADNWDDRETEDEFSRRTMYALSA
jgi:hypothetical protein